MMLRGCRGIRCFRAGVGLSLLICSCSEQSAGDRPIGGETHFLTCTSDRQCQRLSDAHVCKDGVCQISDSDAASGEQGQPDAGCAGAPAGAREVVILGDSFFGSTHEITSELEQLAKEAGILATDEQYRDHSRLVANSLAFMGNGIAEQYEAALAEDAIRAVIMNGGGADALLGECEPLEPECPLIVEAVAAAEDLLVRMAGDGVADVVYVFYPDAIPVEPKARVDLLRPLAREVCAQAPVDCHWLDLRPIFDGRYDEYIDANGLNPTTAGAEATAAAIWAVMQSNCITR